MKVYISGQISGRSINGSKVRFRRAANDLKSWQYTPVNRFDKIIILIMIIIRNNLDNPK